MKILFVSAVLPYPLYSGGQVRVFNLLSRLGQKHEITLVTFLRNFSEKQFEHDLPFCKKIITGYRGHAWQTGYITRSMLGSKPLLLTSYDHGSLRGEIERETTAGGYDLIHVEPWYVWPSLPAITVPKVVATHNIEYEVYTEYVRRLRFVPLRPGYYWDVLKLAFWERRVWKRASHIVAVSEDDASVIRKSVHSAVPVSVVPNGVDVSSFRFATKKTKGAPVFLFVGSFTWMQNRDAVAWLVKSIWPILWDRYTGSTLRIVGRSMPAGLRKLVGNPEVKLLEHVENIEEEFHNADLLIAPIRIGGGTSFKILEAMASGLPVVTTTLGATGLNVTGGRELMIADSAPAFVNAVAELLESPKMHQQIARNARTIIERAYTWDRIAATMDRLWYETAKRNI